MFLMDQPLLAHAHVRATHVCMGNVSADSEAIVAFYGCLSLQPSLVWFKTENGRRGPPIADRSKNYKVDQIQKII